MAFINPYNFVPLPDSIERNPPQGHDAMGADNVMGSIEVTWTAESRLLLGSGTGDQFTFAETNGEPVVPGSALHGAIRSFHETLMGGCLRIADLNTVPVHRHTLSAADHRRFKLAIVADMEPTEGVGFVELANVVWVRATCFSAPPSSGERVSLTGAVIPRLTPPNDQGNQRVIREEMTTGVAHIDPAGDRVVLVTDNGAKVGHPEYFATGELAAQATQYSADTKVVGAFHGAITGGMDDGQPSGFVAVKSGGSTIGYRRVERHDLEPGQPYWIRTEGDKVREIRPALMWRYEGQHSVFDRLMDNHQHSLLPCGHDEIWTGELDLCPSCQLFGAAEPATSEQDSIATEVRAYRGHVSVGEATFLPGPPPTPLTMAPLGTPNVTAGQFYLDNDGRSVTNTSHRLPPPALAAWGSDADSGTPRRIRGRKYYWADDTAGRPGTADRARRRHNAAGGDDNTNIARDVQVHPRGTKLTSTIQFVNLTRAQLAALLVSISPALVFEGGVLRIGGGKPLGFGSVTSELKVTVWEGSGRYTGESPAVLDSAQQQDFVTTHLGEVKSWWNHLAAMCRLNPSIGNAPVWYPSDGVGRPGEEAFDEGFQFWKRSAGHHRSARVQGGSSLVSLKDATDPDQVLR